MKIEKLKVEGGYIAKNPLSGSWFCFVGEGNACRWACDTKAEAKRALALIIAGKLKP